MQKWWTGQPWRHMRHPPQIWRAWAAWIDFCKQRGYPMQNGLCRLQQFWRCQRFSSGYQQKALRLVDAVNNFRCIRRWFHVVSRSQIRYFRRSAHFFAAVRFPAAPQVDSTSEPHFRRSAGAVSGCNWHLRSLLDRLGSRCSRRALRGTSHGRRRFQVVWRRRGGVRQRCRRRIGRPRRPG